MAIDAKVLRTEAVVEFSKADGVGYCYECGSPLARNVLERTILQKAGCHITGLGTPYQSGNWQCPKCYDKEQRLEELDRIRRAKQPRPLRCGDPWGFECFARFIPGGRGQAFSDWDYLGDHQEVLVLNHQNGARGMLWDLETVIEAAA